MIDMSSIRRVHFIGIGGVSVSAIAEILHTKGYEISGSDMASSATTDSLKTKGFDIYIGHASENIKGADLIVYTAAASDDNPELTEASKLGIPCLSRAEMLGQLMLDYPFSIAISGTHGKTSTTSMVTRLFNDSLHDPTALVGGFFKDIQSNVKIGSSDYFITEACEYKESFLSFYPQIGVILNIDEDHLDYYRDLDHIISAFVKFTENIHESGLLIINGDDYNSKKIKPYYKGNLMTFGLSDSCDINARGIVYNRMGHPSFDVYLKDKKLTSLSLSIPGQHNIYNALAAFTVAIQYIDDYELIADRLNSFQNANRRFELIGESQGITVIDDYAHHPNAIRVAIEAAKRIESVNHLYCIFQPHTYSRTKELLHEFASAFNQADTVLLTDIYAAREVDNGEIHSTDLLREMESEPVNSLYYSSFDEIVDYLSKNCQSGDLVMTVGAGDVYKIGKKLIEQLNQV